MCIDIFIYLYYNKIIMSRAEAVVANIERRVSREAEKISAVLEWWLFEEANRVSANNAYLDDFTAFRDGLHASTEDMQGNAENKANSHYYRLIAWTNQTIENETELSSEDYDYLLARQLFGVLMLLSGNVRTQALLVASTQEEYGEYRSDRTLVGVDIRSVVQDRVWWHRAVKEQREPDAEQQQLFEDTLKVNDLAHAWTGDFLYTRGKYEPGRSETEAHEMGHMAEQAWIELAVDYIFYMDTRNFELGRTAGYDGFANVPLLEPKSITLDPKIIYPFARAA